MLAHLEAEGAQGLRDEASVVLGIVERDLGVAAIADHEGDAALPGGFDLGLRLGVADPVPQQGCQGEAGEQATAAHGVAPSVFASSLVLAEPGAGNSPRRASHFLLRRQKKVTKEKATPLSATPALRSGATCGARASGLPQNSRRSLRSLCSDSCGKSDHEACLSFGRHAAGCTALLGAARGEGERLGPSLRSAANGLAQRGLDMESSSTPQRLSWRSLLQAKPRRPTAPHTSTRHGALKFSPSARAEERRGVGRPPAEGQAGFNI